MVVCVQTVHRVTSKDRVCLVVYYLSDCIDILSSVSMVFYVYMTLVDFLRFLGGGGSAAGAERFRPLPGITSSEGWCGLAHKARKMVDSSCLFPSR